MTRKKYNSDFKSQIIKEAMETNNTALVGKRHNISQRTVYNWYIKAKNKEDESGQQVVRTLKKELQESKAENQILRELLKKTYQVWPSD